jgi:hypothetical protein
VSKLLIATPLYGAAGSQSVALQYHQAMCAMLRDPQIEVLPHRCWTNMDLVRARSRAVEMFLRHPGAEHLLFWDSDVGGDALRVAGILVAMLRARRDIVCAPYPMKRIRWDQLPTNVDAGVDFEAHAYAYPIRSIGEVDSQGFQECDRIPMGFTLISREAVEHMRRVYREELCFHDVLDTGDAMETVALFQLLIEPGPGPMRSLLSEDFSFVARARACGFRAWAYLGDGSPLDHVGSHVFRGAKSV